MSTSEHHMNTLENIDSTEKVPSECNSVNLQEIEHLRGNGISSPRPEPEGCSVSEKGNQLCQSEDGESVGQVPNKNHVFADNANKDICVDKKVSERSNSSSLEDNVEIMYTAGMNGDCLTQCEDRTKLLVDNVSADVLPVTMATASAQSNIVNTAMPFISSTAHSLSPNVFQGTLLHAMPSVPMQIYDPSSGHVGPCHHPHLAHQHCVVSPHHYYHHDSAAAVTPPPPLLPMGTSTPSANTVPQVNGNSSGAAAHHQHVVHVHINPGEKLTIRVEDQYQNIDGPATVRMVSNNGPPLPMPMQVPPGHMVQQIVDENGILTHVILSPQPPGMMGGTMPIGGPANSPQYYAPYRGHYPRYSSPHPHSHHGDTSPTTQASSPQINSMDEQVNARRDRMRKRLRENESFGNRASQQTNKKRGTNGVDSHISANIISTLCHSPEEIADDRVVIQSQLSKMPKTQVNCGPLCIVQVDDIEARSVLIHLLPPAWDDAKYDLDTPELCYELLLGDKGPDSKYKLVYIGDATEIMLKDLKPATEYHLKVCAILDDIRGSETKPISFKTVPCEPDQPQSPKLYQKSKTTLYLKWVNPCENGSKISTYILEYDNGEGLGNFVEVYNGLQKQHRLSKLKPSTKYTFRLAAVNGFGKSAYSDPMVFCTSGLVPLQPNPPMLCESHVKELLLSWIKGPFDEEFTLQLDDGVSGHGFMTVYNGPLLSYRITNLTRNKEYKFRLCTKNEEGSSKWSEVVQYKTLPARPDCPGKPQVKGRIQPHAFRIIWDPPKDDGGAAINKYIVELDDGNGSETVFEGVEREHLCNGLVPGHTYRVHLAACNSGGQSDFSEACKVTTQAVPPGQCQAPKLQGKPKATSLHLRWAYPDSTGGSSITEFATQMILPDNTCQEVYRGHELDCLVANLSPGRPYLFQVQAFNCVGAGPWSEPLEVVSGAGVPDPPKMPQLTCRSAHSAIVSWEEPVNNGATITEYRLEWQLQSDKDFTQLYFGPCKSYEVKGLSAATSYAFRVQAINSAGPGLYSPAAICCTPASSPSAVVSIYASPSATSVHLSWKAPRDNGSEIYAYNIDIVDKQLLCVGALTEYTIEELSPEMTYKVRIQAVNGFGVGAFSPVVKFTTKMLPPSPPRLECCGTTHNCVKLKWGEGRNVDLITFTLEMVQKGGSGNYQEVYKGQSYACKINRLSEMTTYHFRIQASNIAGSGPYSDTCTCLTTKAPPPALKAPKVEEITLTSCNIEWQGCRPIGDDKILYILQLQSGDHEYRQIYKGPDSSFHLDDLQCKAEYLVRVCAIRRCSDDTEIIGAFSPGLSFTTASPEPIKALVSSVIQSKDLERKQLTDQQLAAVFLVAFFTVAVLIAVIIQHI